MDPQVPADALGARRILLWGIVGVAVIAGVVLYFRYERLLQPLIG